MASAEQNLVDVLAYGQPLGSGPYLQNGLFALGKPDGDLNGKNVLLLLIGSGRTEGAASPPAFLSALRHSHPMRLAMIMTSARMTP